MRKLATIGLSVIALFAIACGIDTGTDSTVSGDGSESGAPVNGNQGPVTAAMGQTVTLTNESFGDKTVVDVTLANPQQFAEEPGDFGMQAQNGVFLVINVVVVCNEGTYHANPFNFKFVGADGSVFDGAFVTEFDPHLNGVDLNAGQRTEGNIIFDVPAAALTGGKIQLDGIGFDYDQAAAYWTV